MMRTEILKCVYTPQILSSAVPKSPSVSGSTDAVLPAAPVGLAQQLTGDLAQRRSWQWFAREIHEAGLLVRTEPFPAGLDHLLLRDGARRVHHDQGHRRL